MPIKRARLLSLPHGCISTTPNASTTYYFGIVGAPMTTSTGIRRMYIPKNGIIRIAEIWSDSIILAGSSESWPMQLRLNGATNYTIASTATANEFRSWLNYNMNIPVGPGDYVEIRTATPAWVTPPQGVTCSGCIVVEVP